MFCVADERWEEIIGHVFAATLASSDADRLPEDELVPILDQLFADMAAFRAPQGRPVTIRSARRVAGRRRK
jgi:hypothetical protein